MKRGHCKEVQEPVVRLEQEAHERRTGGTSTAGTAACSILLGNLWLKLGRVGKPRGSDPKKTSFGLGVLPAATKVGASDDLRDKFWVQKILCCENTRKKTGVLGRAQTKPKAAGGVVLEG